MKVPSEVVEELSRALGVEVGVIEGFVGWLLGNYLVRYPSVGLLRLAIDVLNSGDSRTAALRRALGINSSIDVEVSVDDPLFLKLLASVRSVVKALAKVGIVEYVEDLDVVNLVRD